MMKSTSQFNPLQFLSTKCLMNKQKKKFALESGTEGTLCILLAHADKEMYTHCCETRTPLCRRPINRAIIWEDPKGAQ